MFKSKFVPIYVYKYSTTNDKIDINGITDFQNMPE